MTFQPTLETAKQTTEDADKIKTSSSLFPFNSFRTVVFSLITDPNMMIVRNEISEAECGDEDEDDDEDDDEDGASTT